MTLVYSGQISLGDIADEFSVSRVNVSLRGRSSAAAKGIPDAMSEFWGYTAVKATFNHADQLFGPNSGTVTGTITVFKPNTVVTVTVFGGITSGGYAYGSYYVPAIGTCSVGVQTQYMSGQNTMNFSSIGTYYAEMSLTTSGQGGSSAAYIRVNLY